MGLANLSGVEFGLGGGVGAVGRDMDVSVNIVFGSSLDNSLRAFDMYIFQREVPIGSLVKPGYFDAHWGFRAVLRRIIAADKVVNDV